MVVEIVSPGSVAADRYVESASSAPGQLMRLTEPFGAEPFGVELDLAALAAATRPPP
jgi:hypothetical protein